MGKRQFILGIFFASILGGAIAIGGYMMLSPDQTEPYGTFEERQNVVLSKFESSNAPKVDVPAGLNFVNAAKLVTPGVVHIKSTYENSDGYASRNPIFDMFGNGDSQSRRSRASGSGVIISDDGYIVTNNHVIDNASKIEVALNTNQKFEAEIVGTDPTTDLALLKVEGDDLPFVKFGDSDQLLIGEWVLAVGNPYDLTSTVTAGIVSAKGRNIDILRNAAGNQIESFIQTDAVVNPGNSGGALVNLQGELIGINTAIASPTGSFAGYSFAVPVTLVKKVMNDLKEFGEVQRAMLGISIVDVDNPNIEDDVDALTGVYIRDVFPNTAAEDAGLRKGDIIIKIEDTEIASVPELQERVARKRIGETITVTYIRDNKKRTTEAVLKNPSKNFEVVRRAKPVIIEGASFENINDTELSNLGIRSGVKIGQLKDGKWAEAGLKKGFIITSIDRERVTDVASLQEIMSRKEGEITVLGIYENGRKDYFSLDW